MANLSQGRDPYSAQIFSCLSFVGFCEAPKQKFWGEAGAKLKGPGETG